MERLFCQCCGMQITDVEQLAKTSDGTIIPDYCSRCFVDGALIETTLKEQIDKMRRLQTENGSVRQETTSGLCESMSDLKRWLPREQKLEWVVSRCDHAMIDRVLGTHGTPVRADVLHRDGLKSIYLTVPTKKINRNDHFPDYRVKVTMDRGQDIITFNGRMHVVIDRSARMRVAPEGFDDDANYILHMDVDSVDIHIDQEGWNLDLSGN